MTRMVTPGYVPPEQYAARRTLRTARRRLRPRRDPVLDAHVAGTDTGNRPPDRYTAHASLPDRQSVSKAASDGVLDGLELNPGHRPQTVDGVPRPHRSALTALAPGTPTAASDRDATRVEGTRPLGVTARAVAGATEVEPGRRTALLPLFADRARLRSARTDPELVVPPLVVLRACARRATPSFTCGCGGRAIVSSGATGRRCSATCRFGSSATSGMCSWQVSPRSCCWARRLRLRWPSTASRRRRPRRTGCSASAAPARWPRSCCSSCATECSSGPRSSSIVWCVLAVDDGRLTPVGQGLWVVAGVFLVGAIGFHPEPWPF